MLIQALCDYYDMLSRLPGGKVLPDGYSKVSIGYLIALKEDGTVDEIIEKKNVIIEEKNGKQKIRKVPIEMILPKRTEKTGIESNIVEHRPLYIFGLNLEKDLLSPNDKTGKAHNSHQAFVETNIEFIEGIHSPIVDAYRAFLQSWVPDNEINNDCLKVLGKEYGKSGYAFCLSGQPDCLLHDDPDVKKRWEARNQNKNEKEQNSEKAQCAVSGSLEPIARIHSKIKGVYGGLATGSVLIGFNNDSESSYGNEQSYNSNISESAMKKYTESLNYLLSSRNHKVLIDDITIVFWAMSNDEEYEDLFIQMLMGDSEKMDAVQTELMLQNMLDDARDGTISEKRIGNLNHISSDVDFFLLGLKPNSSRLSVKFLIRKKYADVLFNIAKFQKELQITQEFRMVPLYRIKKELISPKSKNEKVNPALLSSLLEAVIYHKELPISLLETVVRRVKIDSGKEKLNTIRAGLIKACINRNMKKEELKVALDKDNHEQSYLCGRLFAVLEKLQQEASGNSLNRTIKDAYFASASAKPALVFPKLIRLAQNHLNKVSYPVYYNKLLGEIMGQLDGEFPDTFMLKDQGRFIVGYYQQYQSFFDKKERMEDK